MKAILIVVGVLVALVLWKRHQAAGAAAPVVPNGMGAGGAPAGGAVVGGGETPATTGTPPIYSPITRGTPPVPVTPAPYNPTVARIIRNVGQPNLKGF